MLEDYGYNHKKKAGQRRTALKKAIRDLNYDFVIERLEELREETESDYHAGRINADINHFRKKSDRFIGNGGHGGKNTARQGAAHRERKEQIG